MNKKISTKKGFTIIEVVLVLAIAGLIFLMVFVALPSLQKSQRDTQRRSDVARLATAITNYQANNDNSMPSDNSFVGTYLSEGFKDPSSGNAYNVSISAGSGLGTNGATGGNVGDVVIYTGAYCYGEFAKKKGNGTSTTSYAIVTKLEGSGSICLDNQ